MVRACYVLARSSANDRGLVAHAQHNPLPHAHHRPSRDDITTRSAAASRSAKRRRSDGHAPELLFGPVGLVFLNLFIDFLAFALMRREKGHVHGRAVAQNRELRKRGAVSSETKRNGPSPHTNDRVRTETRSTEILELGKLRTARVLNCPRPQSLSHDIILMAAPPRHSALQYHYSHQRKPVS